jgi:hypothetical protein
MNHCNKCGNNIPDNTDTCEEAGFGDGCGNKIDDTLNLTPTTVVVGENEKSNDKK